MASEYTEQVKEDVKSGLKDCAKEYYLENKDSFDSEEPTDEEVSAAEEAFEECADEVYAEYGEDFSTSVKACVKEAAYSYEALEDDEMTEEEFDRFVDEMEAAVDYCIDEYYESVQAEEAEEEAEEETEEETEDEDSSDASDSFFLQKSQYKVFSN